ncbi:hypothetical protein B0H10DRAFT_1941847 [Mycena sp. CBHHK59/15]|nr:hypothetical protein B0H10DRAFT_1941847 [Mycena sp. CBHHK59/15]
MGTAAPQGGSTESGNDGLMAYDGPPLPPAAPEVVLRAQSHSEETPSLKAPFSRMASPNICQIFSFLRCTTGQIQYSADLEYYPPNIPHGALEFPIQGIDQLSDPTISFDYKVINPNDYLNMSDGANFNTANFDIGMAHFSDPLSTNYSHFPDFDQYSFNSTGGLEIPVFHSADLHDQYHDDLPVLPMPQSSPITTTVQEEPIQHQVAAKKRGREEVDKANIVQGRQQKTQSRRARVEA